MISFLRGKIINKRKNFFIVEAHDVGYQVFVNQNMIAEFGVGHVVELYTHQYIKEDALDLYGFKSWDELEVFELLISISGIGPKSALGVMAIAGIEDLKTSIARGDSSLLTKVSGIGRKTAERIVLELREKIPALGGSASGGATESSVDTASDEIDALIALGYSLQQAREALKQVDPGVTKSSERIREALKKLGK